jgi:hypothetical protein
MTRDGYDLFGRPDRGRFGDHESQEIRGNDSVRSDLVDLPLALHYETPARGANPGAVLVSIDGDEAKAQWIPKSRCEVEKHKSYLSGRRRNGTATQCQSVTVTLPERLAKDKGLI